MSDKKFGRWFILRVQTPLSGTSDFRTPFANVDGYVEVRTPFTLEFNIVRNILASANTANFTVYNLKSDTREKIYKDVYDTQNLKALQLFAGYAEKEGELIPRCFNGTIKRAYSYRQGPDFKTVIEAYDGMISMGTDFIKMTVPPSLPMNVVIGQVANELKNVDAVTIGNKFTDITKRAMALMGNPLDIMKQITNNNFYIDNQSAYALDSSEVVQGEVRLLNYENGLIGTPKVSELMVEAEMLFEPRIKPGQLIELQSLTEKRFNGVYRVAGLIHRGIISGSIGGDCKTILTLQRQKNSTVVFDKATNEYRVVTSGE